MAELSNQEKLKLQREQRRARILAKGEQRLEKIVKTYSGGDGAEDSNSSFEVITKPADGTEEAKDNAIKDSNILPEDVHSAKSPAYVKESPGRDAAVAPRIVEEKPASRLETPAFMVDKDLALPFDDEDFASPKPVKPKQKNYIHWFHTTVFTTIALVAFSHWLIYHSHAFFELESKHQNVWYKQMCRQLVYLRNSPAESSFGATSKISMFGTTVYAWVLFLSIEIGLLTIRLVYGLRKGAREESYIPEFVKTFMVQFGYDPIFYENLIWQWYEYYDIYNMFMEDMYLIIVFMGLSVSVAVVADQYQLCQ